MRPRVELPQPGTRTVAYVDNVRPPPYDALPLLNEHGQKSQFEAEEDDGGDETQRLVDAE